MNYQEEVKKVYPDAWSDDYKLNRLDGMCFIRIDNDWWLQGSIGKGETIYDAWQSAYNTLVAQGKIIPSTLAPTKTMYYYCSGTRTAD